MAAPQPSARLVRAVAAERSELERHRARMTTEAAELRAALARIEHGLAEIDERCDLLDRLAASADAPNGDVAARRRRRAAPRGAARPRDPRTRRSTSCSRAAAMRCTTGAGSSSSPTAGHAIAGKDPLAVFLTQITRSPVVQRGADAGVYALDRHAPREARADPAAAPARPRAHRAPTAPAAARITAEIGRTERALEEARQALDPTSRLAASHH